MDVEVTLFGAFRDCQPEPSVRLLLAEGASVAELRAALDAHGRAHWPKFNHALLARSAFASETAVLRDHQPVPAGVAMAVLPPVSGG
jgi:molybdopterin synthase sulfur carrier subunit